MDDNSRSNSSNQTITDTLNTNSHSHAKIHAIKLKSHSRKNGTLKARGRHFKAALLRRRRILHSILRRPISRYLRVFKRYRRYKRYVARTAFTLDKTTISQKQLQKPKRRLRKRRRRLNKYDSNTFSRNEFYRRISVISALYDKLPIIKSKRDGSGGPRRISDALNKAKRPVLVETVQGLDIRFNLAIIIDILSCSLCKGLFYNAHTIKECMHTFCKSCLILSTFENGLVCPICSCPIHSDFSESIEYDHNIQGLVDKLFPRFCEMERRQMRDLDAFLGRPTTCKQSSPENSSPVKEAPRPRPILLDSTSDFMKDVARAYRSIDALIDNVLCLALLHEDDNDLRHAFKNVRYNPDDLLARNPSEHFKKYPRKYICVPKTVYVDHIVRYMAHELVLEPEYNVVFTLKNAVLSKNHTVEFICKCARIDMSKCVILRYRVILESHH